MNDTIKPPKKIIIRMPNWIGDAVMATPVLADIRKHFKEADITLMCLPQIAALLKNDPHVDHIFSFQQPSGWIHRLHHAAIINPLRQGKYDLGILLTNSFSSAYWFFRGKVNHRIGYATHKRSFLLTKKVPLPTNIESQHLVLTYKMILEPLGISPSDENPRLYITQQEKKQTQELLALYGIKPDDKIVGINPGAAYGTAKCWLPKRFAEVTKKVLQETSAYVLYFGDNLGAPLVADICKEMPDRVVNLAGKTSLRELLALIERCSVLLTNDSGPMHMADALNTPLVALFGSTSDIKTGPYKSGIVIHKHVECSPCYKRVCPIDFRCMKRIEVDEVFNAINSQLSGFKR